ncbi:DsbA family protein [Alcanivorax sp.]|uniref:DsbA family protein n=1 Tax=Alcanivorax sp. TaxID=1872427 RepID=UPI00258431E7|nr:DsbA family protein [Alcanivorax sp.]
MRAAAVGIWSQGINAASDNGLKFLVENAGLDWNRARRWLDDDSWRDLAEDNRNAMMEAGSWGVPSFMTQDDMVWGQDRFAIIENSLLASQADDRN